MGYPGMLWFDQGKPCCVVFPFFLGTPGATFPMGAICPIWARSWAERISPRVFQSTPGAISPMDANSPMGAMLNTTCNKPGLFRVGRQVLLLDAAASTTGD
ncbi:unnamed protein product [Ectocarpus sp. 12 AP-2014]